MDVPVVQPFLPTDEWILEMVERTRIQMSSLYFEPNCRDHFLLDETAPSELLEVVASYRRALGREVADIGGGDTSIETIRGSTGHYWLFTSDRFQTGGHLAAGGAWFSQDTSEVWALEWIYIHPFERGHGLLNSLKPLFDEIYPGYLFDGPFTNSGRKACLKLAGGDESRLCG